MQLIEELPFISEELAQEEANKVLGLTSYHYRRMNNIFSTLGASAYLDLPNDYVHKAAETNPIIDEHFSELLKAAKNRLSHYMQLEVIDLPDAGRIGFHVFDSRANGQQANWHIDLPFQNVRWCEPFSYPFSFTVPLTLPNGIGGLEYRDNDGNENYLPYTIGNMYLSSGLFPHRIANPVEITEGQTRITLQGHGAILGFSNKAAIYF